MRNALWNPVVRIIHFGRSVVGARQGHGYRAPARSAFNDAARQQSSRWRSPPAGTRYRTGAPSVGRGPARAGHSARNRLPSSGGPLRPTAGARHVARPSSASPAAAHRGGAGGGPLPRAWCGGSAKAGAAANAVAALNAMASKRVVFMGMPPSWPQHAALWREYRAIHVNECGCRRCFSEQTARPAVAARQRIIGPRPGPSPLRPSLRPTTEKDPFAGQCAPRAMQPMRTPHLPARPGPKARRENRSCRTVELLCLPGGPRCVHPRLRQAVLAFELLCADRSAVSVWRNACSTMPSRTRELNLHWHRPLRCGLGRAAVGPVP